MGSCVDQTPLIPSSASSVEANSCSKQIGSDFLASGMEVVKVREQSWVDTIRKFRALTASLRVQSENHF